MWGSERERYLAASSRYREGSMVHSEGAESRGFRVPDYGTSNKKKNNKNKSKKGRAAL